MVDIESIKNAHIEAQEILLELQTWARVSVDLQGDQDASDESMSRQWPWLLARFCDRLLVPMDRVESLIYLASSDGH